MEVVFYFSCLLLGCIIGSLIGLKKTKCNHNWNLIEKGYLTYLGSKKGMYKIYECEHCLKMKSEKVDIND